MIPIQNRWFMTTSTKGEGTHFVSFIFTSKVVISFHDDHQYVHNEEASC